MNCAPIALFVYNRPWHTRRTVEALRANAEAVKSPLYIFSDAPKNAADEKAVNEVRQYISEIDGFSTVHIIERTENYGLARSIIDGVTKVCQERGCVIVLEDDIVVSRYFFKYMNDALKLYEHDERVISIVGYQYPIKAALPETFFLKGADCWGWATWKRGWDLFEPDGRTLLREMTERKLTHRFDFDGSYPYTRMLRNQIIGKNNSWAIRWYASAFLKDKLTLYPGRSLVLNIGNDSTGIHCSTTSAFTGDISSAQLKVELIPVEENLFAWKQISKFFQAVRPWIIIRIIRKLVSVPRYARASINIKTFAKKWLPPALISHLKPLLKYGIYFSGNYPDWAAAKAHASGYDSTLILERVKQARLKVMAGDAKYERDSVLFEEVQHSFPMLAGLLRAAIENGEQLSVLDFGGSLGSSYFQCRDFLSMLPSLIWGVVEQEHFVECGREQFETENLKFYYTIAECIHQTKPNVALLSSVLQYLPEPNAVLNELITSEIPYIIIDHTPFSKNDEDRITVQQVPALIYAASYPCRIFGQQSLHKIFHGHYEVIACFDSSYGSAITNDLEFSFGGMILRKYR